MFEDIRRKRGVDVAQVAILVGRQVIAVLEPGRIGGEKELGMATLAALRNAVVNIGEEVIDQEIAGRCMANAAIVLGRNVIEFLRCRQAGVVARRAIVRVYALVVINNPGESREVGNTVARRAIGTVASAAWPPPCGCRGAPMRRAIVNQMQSVRSEGIFRLRHLSHPDADIARLARALNLTVVPIHALPLPPEDPQGTLDLEQKEGE